MSKRNVPGFGGGKVKNDMIWKSTTIADKEMNGNDKVCSDSLLAAQVG